MKFDRSITFSFAPDGRQFASASFDKSLKIWDAHAAKFLCTLRGHVGAVYQVCWSSDSRLIVSGSKDSTMKVGTIRCFVSVVCTSSCA